ncbi:MAG: HD-GYP domain-containing protein [bacterium]|nr:HD-GYP domain-containing protein [bacterium]
MRLDFLARFAAVLLVVVVAISAGLSYAFARVHLASVKSDLIATAIGQASATLQPALDRYARSGSFTETDRERIDASVRNVENFQAIVRDVRIYRPDGAPLDPILAPDATSYVKSAIAQQNFVESPERSQNGDQIVTVYVPLASPMGSGYLAVAAIDVSIGQLNAQTRGETQFVVIATLVACIVIFLSLLTLAVAAQRELDRRRDAAEKTFLQTMEGIASIVDQRDPYTAGHSMRVAEYSVAIARQMGLRKHDVETVRCSALLHDLGKIGIPDAVLLKPGPLDTQEREIINEHPVIAREILGPVEAMAEITPCVLHHHERWDGKGYPDGLAGERIPLLSRVIAVADTFDAMTTDRPYRTRLSLDEARGRLLSGIDVQWDRRCVEAMVALIDGGEIELSEQREVVFGRRLSLRGAT